MSDEEDSMSEGFSASEDEWKPNKDLKGGESSDDDDSEFEESALTRAAGNGSGSSVGRKRGEPKVRGAAKQAASKKRVGLSLRAKLYNKYRPPPKTLSPCSSLTGRNSPTASTSRSISKNATAPNESKNRKTKTNDGEDSFSSSDSSIENYLVNFEDLDIQSSFFNVGAKSSKNTSASPAPIFDCNAGLKDLSDSVSDGEQTKKDEKTFDFNNLLEYAKRIEHFKENVAKHNAEEASNKPAMKNIDTLDVYSVLALGEKHNRSHNDGEDEDDDDDDQLLGNETRSGKNVPSKLSKTKSTRIKRHTKTRPSSTVAANDTDDSEWEEVADSSENVNRTATSNDISKIGNLEIHVELPSRNGEKKTKTKQDIEMVIKRRLNRDLKERQVLLHKASLLCHFGRIFFYNRLLNNIVLIRKALKLLPTKSAYPPGKGTEIKYFQSMVTWFKSVIKLKSQNLYPEKSASKTKAMVVLLKQIEDKVANSKQELIFIFIILLRGMGLQCRLIANLQPLSLKPAQSDLLTIKLKTNDQIENKKPSSSDKNIKKNESGLDNGIDTELKLSTSKKENTYLEISRMETKNRATKNNSKNLHNSDVPSTKSAISCDNPEANAKSSRNGNQIVQNNRTEIEKQDDNNKDKNLNGADIITNKKKQAKSVTNKSKVKSTKQEILPNISYTAVKSIKPVKLVNKRKPQKNDDVSNNSRNSSKENIISLNLEGTESDKCEHFISKEKPKNLDIKTPKPARKQIVKAQLNNKIENCGLKRLESSQKKNKKETNDKPSLVRLKRTKPKDNNGGLDEKPNKQPRIDHGSALPKMVIHCASDENPTELPCTSSQTRKTHSRSQSPQAHISTEFLLQGTNYKEKCSGLKKKNINSNKKTARVKSSANKLKISTDFLQKYQHSNDNRRVLRARQKKERQSDDSNPSLLPQLDGANDDVVNIKRDLKSRSRKKKNPNLNKLKVQSSENSDEDFEISPPKKPKVAPTLSKKNRRVVSSDDENDKLDNNESTKRKPTAGDLWVEVWCDVEEQWVCVDIFKGKLHCVDTIRKSASGSLAYVFAFQNNLSIKDVTARYCPNWATVVRKSRVDSVWLNTAITKYLGHPTMRDIKEDQELRRLHEEKPMPTAISEYKNHPFYALERHLLKFEALYPPDAPALHYVRGHSVYSRDCVHTLHSREIWLKQARTVKLGEKPYKIVKARPKWDKITQTIIKDQPLEIFGYWQTQEYEPPTAENGLVPRNAYGNVELFKSCMLPKKAKHINLPGLNRICKKLGIDCANAVVGFDFHQGACHPTYDGFVVCEEFEDQVVAAWHQDQEEQERKTREKYETRVYGNWKKLIRGLLIRERLKLKYNF